MGPELGEYDLGSLLSQSTSLLGAEAASSPAGSASTLSTLRTSAHRTIGSRPLGVGVKSTFSMIVRPRRRPLWRSLHLLVRCCRWFQLVIHLVHCSVLAPKHAPTGIPATAC